MAGLLIMGFLGGIFGLFLAIASKVFTVKVDPRVERIIEVLPGANCGACGQPGCSGYAEAVAAGKAPPNLCIPGGTEVCARVAAIMEVEAVAGEQAVAVLLCRATGVGDKLFYDGIQDCRAASLIHGGSKACHYGCLGLSSCERACPFGAIHMGEDGLPIVDESACTACGICARVCPKNLFKILPSQKYVHVQCQSHDKGGVVTKVCKVGCIACKKCEKVCKFDAIHVEDFLAIIDYEKCTSCGACVKECPREIIVNYRKLRKGGGIAA